ncbi:Putrescine transport ATP-binding protein PotA (TC 3.A.1.11.1) [Tritonibacter mobilis]|uniref:ABC transporter ATP-binding protein n=1 Tax=Tritonibacter mobilis TaxID=379347 RepID=UPI000F6FFAD2|nr:ABC transporter ATP-binding protein [Tritonibacter mobilis]VCU59122.1 Putrescine transport ATP-binding protein PotA (TC 3.A.1.11.1) [Tritonibacter mobilis]
MTELVLCDVSRRYGAALAINSLNLTVSEGEFLTLLGPSGCGKSTTLASIAGLDQPTGGRITFGDRVLVDADTGAYLPPEARGFGVVFQSYALWPHMTVENNVAMSLKLRKVPSAERKKRVVEVLDLVELGGLAKRYPGELSGGQQQRVALARAIVFRPPLLLLDEPLSNLDAQLRQQARVWLKDIQRELGLTTIYVTHDQDEALAMSDRIVVMRGGKVIQLGTPKDIYRDPQHPFAASFIGNANLLEVSGGAVTEPGACTVTLADGQPIHGRAPVGGLVSGKQLLAVRPHLIRHEACADASEITVEFGAESYLGDHFEQDVHVAGITLRLSVEEPQPRGTGRIWIRQQDAVVFCADS